MSSFNKYFYQNVGKKIRKYRTERGLTQEKLSEMLNLNLKYIGHVERFERKISNSTLIKLMELWQIQPEDFFKFNNKYNWENEKNKD